MSAFERKYAESFFQKFKIMIHCVPATWSLGYENDS